jgi:hypothetical protein
MKQLIRHILKEETEDNLKNLAIEDMTFAMEIAGGFENIIKKTNPTEKEIDEMITCYLDQNLYPDYNWERKDYYIEELENHGVVDFFVNDELLYCYYLDYEEREPFTIQLEKDLSKRLYKIFDDKWVKPFVKWFEYNTGLKVKEMSLFDDDYNRNTISLNENSKSKHVKVKETFQYMVDFVIEEMRDICDNQNEDTEDLVSFDVCDFLLANTKIKVTSFDYYNDRPRLLIHITYLNTIYIDEEPFISELQRRIKRWIGDNTVEIEDITFN